MRKITPYLILGLCCVALYPRSAAALVFSRLAQAPPPVSVRVRGGDTLQVGFEPDGDGWKNVTLTGPADFVFEGDAAL